MAKNGKNRLAILPIFRFRRTDVDIEWDYLSSVRIDANISGVSLLLAASSARASMLCISDILFSSCYTNRVNKYSIFFRCSEFILLYSLAMFSST